MYRVFPASVQPGHSNGWFAALVQRARQIPRRLPHTGAPGITIAWLECALGRLPHAAVGHALAFSPGDSMVMRSASHR
ncbi:hypothetical protein PAMC26510_17750 [Caballeronia sordidicola]|uniref:Uncharacterized protein n=1 Tax=Caballeronia sordidicola TaxID=196367 RepID=A0A242MRP5_CABSO|nr:hypothetical protein PAMC26510_17750 [Caballeronia sordidicola]